MSDDKQIRMWHPAMGDGTLYFSGNRATERFVADSGAVVPLDWCEARTGRPGKRLGKQGSEEWNWMTFKLRSGEVYMFRHGGKPS